MTEADINFSEIKDLLQRPKLQLHLRPEWGSQHSGFRQAIKDDIQLKKFSLSQVSISHEQNLGGYLLDPDIEAGTRHSFVNDIGFDLEITGRVSRPVALRVSNIDELTLAPSAASLWTAKEACFKSLRGPEQPQLLSQLELGQWQKKTSHLETVQLISVDGKTPSSTGFGVVIHQDNYTLSFFSLRS